MPVDTEEAKRRELARIPNYLAPSQPATADAEAIVRSLREQLDGQPPEVIRAVIAGLQAKLPPTAGNPDSTAVDKPKVQV